MMSLALCRSGIFSVLTFALLAQPAWGQRLGPLVKDNQQRSTASSAESTAAAVQPPSLRLSLPAPAVATLPPVGPDDLQRLQPQEGRPPVIGVHRRLPPGAVTQSFSGGTVKTFAEGAWQSTVAGRLWRLKTTSPSARAMRIHFRDFAIGAGSLWLHSPSGQVVGPYSGSGLYGDGDFWSGIVFGDSLTIEYLPDPVAAEEAVPFQIVEISHIWDDAFGGGVEAGVRWQGRTLSSPDRQEAIKPLPDRIDVEVGTQSKTSRLTKIIQPVERSVSLQQPHLKAARQLTPGQPADFRLGPIDTTTLFIGDNSFRLEVSENATRVIFTLESVDPDIDVDMYVRFGEDNEVQNRRVVSDYASEGTTGNERIVITPRSDPPLRAGTYFVSIGLFDTGVVAEGTLTAEVELDGESPPPISGGTLTPGQPADFRLGPVDDPTLFTGDHSFQLEVSENASRVIFALESVKPDVDVDLYVRFGENNEVQNRRVVSDYASEGITGNERIVITPRSDPPLRAGTYFVSIGLFDTGVVAEGTLTADVELDDAPLPPTSDRTLTPGQPADFRLGPVDAARLFSGDDSFRLEVSEDATRVIFTLESVDPDIDVDLYVRFGEDNAVQDGEVVSDYASEGITGNERIVITPQSGPPLQAGTYFVSIVLFDTGVAAEGTLTAIVELEGESLPPISGGTLTPGQPADFRLGPVDDPTLFTGNHSFQLEVSENATRVIFTLESVDPDVDVDLYVRFGENNTIQDGRVVADYFSRSDTGNERIGITYRSDPALRAGTYFVSVALFDTGLVADGTITAEVETDAEDCHLDVTCYPEWSSSATGVAQIFFETSEGGSICSGTLLNNRQQDLTPYFLTAAHCVATEEEARSVIAFWHYQTQTCNGDLPDFQSGPRTEGARLLSTLGGGPVDGLPNPVGDMTLLRLEGDLPDDVVFQGWDADSQPSGTQVTGIHHPGSDWGIFKRISFGQIIPNPGDVYATVSYAQGRIEPGSSGSAIFSSPETAVGVASFGEESDFEDVCQISQQLTGYTPFSVFYPRIRQFIDKEFALDFAHFANGASLTSSLVFVNVATHPIRPALYFYDKNGDLIDAESVVDVTGDLEVTENGALTIQTEIEPLGELTLSTHGRENLVTGSVTVDANGPIGGVLRFDLPGIGVAGVGASQPVQDAIFPARRQAGGISTAAAIHNPGEEAMVVNCRLMQAGSVLEEMEISLAANGQEALFIEQMFTATDTSDFVGSVRCTAPGLFTGVAVELDDGNRIFTTLPVVPVDQTGGNNKETALDFAHFANGASLTSSLVFVNVATHPIRPALYFYDKNGDLIDAESVVDVTGDLEVTENGALTIQTEIEPLGELTLSTHGRENLVTGSVTVDANGPIGGVLRFDLPGIGVAGVGASQPVQDAIFPARRQAGGISTAAAIHNPGEEAMVVNCRLMQAGSVLEEMEISLAANGQEALFIEQMFTATDTSDFVGSVRCTAPGLFTGVAVELDDGNRIFTTLPVVPVDQGEINMETPAPAPDLVVQTPSVSDTSLIAGESFTLSAVVRNEGDGPSAATTLRYYRSSNATISMGDTQVGTDAVSGLSASGASDESISLTVPSTAGTYYYGACVDPVSGESDTGNNCSSAVTVTVASSTDKSFNQLQTERLIGTWAFSYTIVSEWTDTYRLNDVRESSITPGEWIITGTDQYDDLVIAGYSPSLGMFSLLDPGITIDQFFTFDFVGSSTVSGCYYQVDKDDNSPSRCYPMTGVRTSPSTLSSLTRALPNTTAAHAELGEIEEAKKLGIEMQIEVDPKIIRILEGLREVLRQ